MTSTPWSAILAGAEYRLLMRVALTCRQLCTIAVSEWRRRRDDRVRLSCVDLAASLYDTVISRVGGSVSVFPSSSPSPFLTFQRVGGGDDKHGSPLVHGDINSYHFANVLDFYRDDTMETNLTRWCGVTPIRRDDDDITTAALTTLFDVAQRRICTACLVQWIEAALATRDAGAGSWFKILLAPVRSLPMRDGSATVQMANWIDARQHVAAVVDNWARCIDIERELAMRDKRDRRAIKRATRRQQRQTTATHNNV